MRRLRDLKDSRGCEIVLLAGFLVLLLAAGSLVAPLLRDRFGRPSETRFQGREAFRHLDAQMALGPRPTGSDASLSTQDLIVGHLARHGWTVEVQAFEYRGHKVRNIVGRAGEGPVAIVGAHYDTRRRADRDPDARLQDQPVPGANDGASGVAVLLELARSLDPERLANEVWLTFFDAEDNGGLDGWEYIVGSSHMAQSLAIMPEMVVILDMIGDADQQIFKERNSDPALTEKIWSIADELGYGAYFLSSEKHAMIDDHTPFARKGIPAVDIIDFDYPHWHTTQDTADKTSAESLERVGRVVEALLEQNVE